MPEEVRTEKPDERMTVVEAQDAIAASIPELERLAWRFFVIARDLEAPEQADDFDESEPGPEHLRWLTASGAMATYSELIALVPYSRKTAERSNSDLREQWQLKQEALKEQEPTAAVPILTVVAEQKATEE